jgi:dihydrofolate reductase
MRKIIVSEFMSLDGVMQSPGDADKDAEGGFAYGGWTGSYWHDEIGAHLTQVMRECDAFLLGRKAWQIMGATWEPLGDGEPFASVMNATPKYVVSTTLTDTSAWRNSTLISGEVVEQVRALKEQPGKNILIYGSSVLLHTLAEHDLIDEYSPIVYPVVLGEGKKVFADGTRLNLRLVEARPLPTGVVLTHYTVERPA